MRKLASILVASTLVIVCSCGPSAKEIAEKKAADSIRVADSMAMVQAKQQRIADSIAKVQAAQKKVADSIAHQDSVKKHLIKKAKPAPTKKAHKK
jgi:hypothetical protein